MLPAAVLSPKDSKVTIKNLDIRNPQGDKKIIEILKRMGAKIEVNPNEIIVIGNLVKNPLNGINIDCSDIPDLFPILSVVGAFAMGKTTLYNASNLRLKECDRISAMARELSKMGIKISEKEEELTIYHSDLKGTTINHEGDHRIAMACIIAALYSNSISMINDAQIIKDSYPNFIDDLTMLGASIELQI
ncbi:MAG: 3-phosphoshikimate 1-carboxyvinyltransferase [Promethearchaeota archaeon]